MTGVINENLSGEPSPTIRFAHWQDTEPPSVKPGLQRPGQASATGFVGTGWPEQPGQTNNPAILQFYLPGGID